MAVDPGVNDDHEEQTGSAEDDQALPVRWWLRRPALGILLSMLLGMAAFLVTASLGTPGSAAGTRSFGRGGAFMARADDPTALRWNAAPRSAS